MSELGFAGLKDFGILFFRAKAHSFFMPYPDLKVRVNSLLFVNFV